MITVKATNTDNRVALWQRHPDHPNGEAYVVGDGTEHQVAATQAVKRALDRGYLVEVEKKVATPKPAATKATDKAD